MKKIINGRLYDTETSEIIESCNSNHPSNDFQWWKETLYRKRSGEFWLKLEGNALSKHAGSFGDLSCHDIKFKPLANWEAQEWAEKNLHPDIYISIFGEVPE